MVNTVDIKYIVEGLGTYEETVLKKSNLTSFSSASA